ncbi:MAG: FTR1 family protein [Patescibacteria group bacterium]
MLPSFLISFREVIEAALIVATILGILVKLNQTKGIKTVWIATAVASGVSVLLLLLGSLFGLEVQSIYTGKVEKLTEGILLTTSAVFITWAVFFLHKYFSSYKVKLLQKLKSTVEKEEQNGLFILVFAAVFREGFEIVLFLSTIYFSSKPAEIFQGFGLGVVAGIIVSLALFSATIKLPIRYAFKTTSVLLILFAGGMLARGIHEFAESGLLPELMKLSMPLVPTNTVVADILKSVFGITKHMDITQIVPYIAYVLFMSWWVFLKGKKLNFTNQNERT